MPAPVLEPMQDTEQFRVLGMVGTEHIAILRKSQPSYVKTVSRRGLTQVSTLIDIAPLAWWHDQCGKAPFGAMMASSFGDAIIRAAERKGMTDLARTSAGRGAHEHGGTVRYNQALSLIHI